MERLKALAELPIVGDVRGSHLMGAFECVTDKESKEPLPADIQVADRIDRHCQARGLILRPLGHLCILSPPLIIREEQIDTMIDIIRDSIEATITELRDEGLWQG